MLANKKRFLLVSSIANIYSQLQLESVASRKDFGIYARVESSGMKLIWRRCRLDQRAFLNGGGESLG